MEKKKYLILTFGCQMNVHESEKLAGILEKNGYEVCTNATQADVVVFNTCAIRENAEQKIYGNIGELKNIKVAKPDMIIAVGGCMSQQNNYANEIMSKFPYVDIVFGTHNLADFEALLKKKIETGKRISSITEDETIALRDSLQIARTSGTNAWVNIMYGCNNFCTYCIVPYVRGREVSRPEKDILREVEALLKEGYKQITLLGQNVNSYRGKDEEGNEISFDKLLADIDKFDYKFRLRFMTSHPKDLSSEVIDVIAKSKHICHGIHLPIQCGSDKILASMNRKYTTEKYLKLIDEIKTKIPDVELTTDIIVGFPGETDEDFEGTLDIMRKVEYMQIFGFIYSKRKGTVAEKMADHIETKVKKDRLSRLLEVKNEIINRKTQEMLGKTYEVLVESFDEKTNTLYCSLDSGKTITVKGTKNCIGEFVDVKVTSVRKSVIYGEIVNTEDIANFKEKNFKYPIEVSILPKDQKGLKLLRENKKNQKAVNDLKSKK
ncbi:MAG: tRNA (N6-isopentenyl adenosine(37)-C2)-methylthiotransferase MiaB [Clostridia bacterium]|nr:tRNA (N6-isopentenyl adenosine(37)-C2)-methylthiotransferase MiaB [Clostridia bacterium]